MAKTQHSDPAAKTSPPALALEKTRKGTARSMWELLLQLRVLLPYLTQMMPLLDRGLRPAPDLGEITKGLAEMQTGSRELEVQARNQAIQLERIEQQMGRLRVFHENSIEDNRKLLAEVRSLRGWLLRMAIVMFVSLLATGVMVTLLFIRS